MQPCTRPAYRSHFTLNLSLVHFHRHISLQLAIIQKFRTLLGLHGAPVPLCLDFSRYFPCIVVPPDSRVPPHRDSLLISAARVRFSLTPCLVLSVDRGEQGCVAGSTSARSSVIETDLHGTKGYRWSSVLRTLRSAR